MYTLYIYTFSTFEVDLHFVLITYICLVTKVIKYSKCSKVKCTILASEKGSIKYQKMELSIKVNTV